LFSKTLFKLSESKTRLFNRKISWLGVFMLVLD
jgi:hypothetical protein